MAATEDRFLISFQTHQGRCWSKGLGAHSGNQNHSSVGNIWDSPNLRSSGQYVALIKKIKEHLLHHYINTHKHTASDRCINIHCQHCVSQQCLGILATYKRRETMQSNYHHIPSLQYYNVCSKAHNSGTTNCASKQLQL